jgi:hypothetical protein
MHGSYGSIHGRYKNDDEGCYRHHEKNDGTNSASVVAVTTRGKSTNILSTSSHNDDVDKKQSTTFSTTTTPTEKTSTNKMAEVSQEYGAESALEEAVARTHGGVEEVKSCTFDFVCTSRPCSRVPRYVLSCLLVWRITVVMLRTWWQGGDM